MASIKLQGSLTSSDLLGFPMEISINSSFIGSGSGKSFSKFTTTAKANPRNPSALPASVFSSTEQKVYIYIRNSSKTDTESVNLYVKHTLTAAVLNATDCTGGCTDITNYIKISEVGPLEWLLIPLAGQDSLYIDSNSGTPTVEFLVLED